MYTAIEILHNSSQSVLPVACAGALRAKPPGLQRTVPWH
jgi:hypothetical protein